MSHLSLPKLAVQTGISRRHLQRMAIDGLIPGATRTQGGHWRVKNGPALERWIKRKSLAKDTKKWAVRDKLSPLLRAAENFETRMDDLLADWIESGKPLPPAELVRLIVKMRDAAEWRFNFVSQAIVP